MLALHLQTAAFSSAGHFQSKSWQQNFFVEEKDRPSAAPPLRRRGCPIAARRHTARTGRARRQRAAASPAGAGPREAAAPPRPARLCGCALGAVAPPPCDRLPAARGGAGRAPGSRRPGRCRRPAPGCGSAPGRLLAAAAPRAAPGEPQQNLRTVGPAVRVRQGACTACRRPAARKPRERPAVTLGVIRRLPGASRGLKMPRCHRSGTRVTTEREGAHQLPGPATGDGQRAAGRIHRLRARAARSRGPCEVPTWCRCRRQQRWLGRLSGPSD